jgi:hypothetical protein
MAIAEKDDSDRGDIIPRAALVPRCVLLLIVTDIHTAAKGSVEW